jgi:hypothetical protein
MGSGSNGADRRNQRDPKPEELEMLITRQCSTGGGYERTVSSMYLQSFMDAPPAPVDQFA